MLNIDFLAQKCYYKLMNSFAATEAQPDSRETGIVSPARFDIGITTEDIFPLSRTGEPTQEVLYPVADFQPSSEQSTSTVAPDVNRIISVYRNGTLDAARAERGRKLPTFWPGLTLANRAIVQSMPAHVGSDAYTAPKTPRTSKHRLDSPVDAKTTVRRFTLPVKVEPYTIENHFPSAGVIRRIQDTTPDIPPQATTAALYEQHLLETWQGKPFTSADQAELQRALNEGVPVPITHDTLDETVILHLTRRQIREQEREDARQAELQRSRIYRMGATGLRWALSKIAR